MVLKIFLLKIKEIVAVTKKPRPALDLIHPQTDDRLHRADFPAREAVANLPYKRTDSPRVLANG